MISVGDATFGDAAVVGAVGVVGVEVIGEVAGEAAVSDVEVAGAAWPPAFFQDGLVEAFDVAVGSGSAPGGCGCGGCRVVGVCGRSCRGIRYRCRSVPARAANRRWRGSGDALPGVIDDRARRASQLAGYGRESPPIGTPSSASWRVSVGG